MTKQTITGFTVITPDGDFFLTRGIWMSKEMALQAFMWGQNNTFNGNKRRNPRSWRSYYRQGYRVVSVKAVVAKVKSNG